MEVELTTNHQGHMTLKLCPINDKNKVTTEECFDQYPLYLADDNSTASYVIPGSSSCDQVSSPSGVETLVESRPKTSIGIKICFQDLQYQNRK